MYIISVIHILTTMYMYIIYIIHILTTTSTVFSEDDHVCQISTLLVSPVFPFSHLLTIT